MNRVDLLDIEYKMENYLNNSLERYLKYWPYNKRHSIDFLKTPKNQKIVKISYLDNFSGDSLVDEFIERYYGKKQLPLIITFNKKKFQSEGIDIPSEFILELNFDNYDEIPIRYENIKRFWADKEYHREYIKDYFVGYLRKKLGIGETAHDISAEIFKEFRKIRTRDKEVKESLSRFNKNDDSSFIKLLEKIPNKCKQVFEVELRRLENKLKEFSEYLNINIFNIETISLKDIIEAISNIKNEIETHLTSIEESFPRRIGYDISIIGAVKPTVLDVDDKAETNVKQLNRYVLSAESPIKLKDLIIFYSFPKKDIEKNKIKRYDFVRQELACFISNKKKYGRLPPDLNAFDFILLDLTFSEPQGYEPGGYSLLDALRRMLPDTPIIIYSAFGQSKHIIKAVQRGADWYCRKDQAYKLPNYLLNVLTHVEWEKEWGRINENKVTFEDFEKKENYQTLDDEKKFIISSLLKEVKGEKITIRKLSGGISGGFTMQAWKPCGDTTPRVLKLNTFQSMQNERERYHWLIQPYLTDNVGQINQPIVKGERWGGIAYTSAGKRFGKAKLRNVNITNLKDLLVKNVESEEKKFVSFDKYKPFFDELIDNVINRLHNVNINDPVIPFPNKLYEEFYQVVDSYKIRLPVEYEIYLEKINDPSFNHKVASLDKGQRIIIEGTYIQDWDKKKGEITLIGRDMDNMLLRCRTKGSYSQFITEHFYLRPGKYIRIEGQINNKYAVWKTALKGFKEYKKYLRDHKLPNPVCKKNTDLLLKSINDFQKTKKGIIHGDLNLGNIILETREGGLPIPCEPHPWLIDFARTRRDAIVHDYVELETAIITDVLPKFLSFDSLDCAINKIVQMHKSIAKERAPEDVEDVKAAFIYDLIIYIRRKACRQGISKQEYLASVSLYYLIVFKLLGEFRSDELENIKNRTKISTISERKKRNDENELFNSQQKEIKKLICFFGAAINFKELNKLAQEII
jgi:CheY-like chemotaxis protein